MRVLIDANVYLSFLLNPVGNSAPARVVESIGAGGFELLFPLETENEIRRNATTKPYLRDRIAESQVEALVSALRQQAVLFEMTSQFSLTSRDPNDTYLLEAALGGEADFLVSGDRDVLVLSPFIERPRIVTPAEFLAILQTA
jgi:putative PIN family toxin of toxin-antitoxin system